MLGRRVDLVEELAALCPLVERLDEPAWWSFLLLTEASQRLQDGRFAEVRAHLARAVAVAGGEGEAGYVSSTLRKLGSPRDRASRPGRSRLARRALRPDLTCVDPHHASREST